MLLNPLTYHRPTSLPKAADLCQDFPNAKLVSKRNDADQPAESRPKIRFAPLKGISKLKGLQVEQGQRNAHYKIHDHFKS